MLYAYCVLHTVCCTLCVAHCVLHNMSTTLESPQCYHIGCSGDLGLQLLRIPTLMNKLSDPDSDVKAYTMRCISHGEESILAVAKGIADAEGMKEAVAYVREQVDDTMQGRWVDW